MAHTFRFAVYFGALLLGLSSFASRHSSYHPDPALTPERQRLLIIANSHVGICEATPGGKRNDGPQVLRFQQSTGNTTGAEWCSAHAVTCFKDAQLTKFLPRGVNGAARSWFHKGQDIYELGKWLNGATTSQPGDVVGYIWPGSKVVHHVGLQFTKWDPARSLVYVNEGNTKDGCVRLVLRPKRVISLISKPLP